jgi:hypothetical protein
MLLFPVWPFDGGVLLKSCFRHCVKCLNRSVSHWDIVRIHMGGKRFVLVP